MQAVILWKLSQMINNVLYLRQATTKKNNAENLDKRYGLKNYNLDSPIDSIYLSK